MIHIQNISLEAVKSGHHFDCGDRAVLIQITDPAQGFPVPKHKFDAVHQFEFLDIDEGDVPSLDEFVITDNQAKQIVKILQNALDEKRNVIVHCHAGICRSGAVVEVGIMMGFIDTEKFRMPNTTVKRKLMQALGWTYHHEEKLNTTDSGIIIASTKGLFDE